MLIKDVENQQHVNKMLENLDISRFLKCLSFFTDLFLEQYDDSLLNIAVTIFRKTELVQKNPVTVNSF